MFTSLGIVIERAGQPPTYERNDAYFTRDEATVLAAECSIEELEADMHDLIDQIWTYQRRYDADTPVGVDISAADITETELADWEAARAEHRCYERAR